ncbi:hypothetical protein GCM10027577_13490 [Spirosoma fluminis]
MANHAHEPICLTIVYPYDVKAGTSLTKETCRTIKQEAKSRLDQWLDLIPQTASDQIKPETLLASPKLAVKLHMLLRRYDYLLVDAQVQELSDETRTMLSQTNAQLISVSGALAVA